MKNSPNNRQSPLSAAIIVPFLVPLSAAILLHLLDVPCGRPGVLVYRYSRLVSERATAAALPIVLALLAVPAYRRFAWDRRLTGRASFLLTLLVVVFLGVWAHLAPPSAANQHFFEMLNVSQEGAFVTEAGHVRSLGRYLAEFPSSLSRTVEQMRGARVLSNPPGVTMLAVLVDRALAAMPRLAQGIVDVHRAHFDARSPEGRAFAQAMCLAWLFTLAWIASGAVLYAVGRLWFRPVPATVVALICFFNPSSAAFSPGKDPAQLLTIAMVMWGFFAAFFRGRGYAGCFGGVALAVGLVSGLIHGWIILIVVLAALWSSRLDGTALRRLCVHCLLPGAAGMAAAFLAAWLVWGWNVPATLTAVARSYGKAADIPPPVWNLAKPPMFALFAGGGVWVLVTVSFRDRLSDDTARFGRAMMWITLAVMLACCPVSALETPRLWLAFVPTWVFGMALCVPIFRSSSPAATRALLLIAVLQVVATCLQWCLFDVRESEWRLMTDRMFH